jgi:regulator of sigma E protease
VSGLYWLLIIPVLGLLIFVHELGHFLTARAMGVKVLEFGFGYPPRLIGIERGGVIYSINAIPIGGFTRMEGENGDSSDPDSFGAKRPWRRALILIAGSAMNLLLAVVIFASVAAIGQPTATGDVQVYSIAPASPAAQAGLKDGDVIVAISGQPTNGLANLQQVVQNNLGKQITLTVKRNGETLPPATIVPRANPPQGEGAMGVGIQAVTVNKAYPIWEAIPMGFVQTVQILWLMIYGIIEMVRGAIPADLAGPIGMAQLTGEVAQVGGWEPVVNLTALLSLNLFLINLLPLPALDGGRLVFVAIEKIRRGKRVPPEKEGYVHFAGMMVLLTFVAIISYFDIVRVINGGSFFR